MSDMMAGLLVGAALGACVTFILIGVVASFLGPLDD